MRELIKNIFDVIVYWNPFLQEVKIEYKKDYDLDVYTVELTYKDVDEWNSFTTTINGIDKVYDVHIHYDESPSVSIYEVVDYTTRTDRQIETELIIKY